jgi:5-methylcytosine-specific restriction protein A
MSSPGLSVRCGPTGEVTSGTFTNGAAISQRGCASWRVGLARPRIRSLLGIDLMPTRPPVLQPRRPTGAKATQQPRRSGTMNVYDDRRWRRVRLLHLKDEPLCRHCKEKGLVVAAEMVDHIKPLTAGGEKYDDSNLQSLCSTCHNIKTAKERAAKR